MATPRTTNELPPLGTLMRYWRQQRNLSQLALAIEADVSPRHMCFLETGRARPSREMVLHIAETLQVPLRERNALLLAAGFAPIYRESNLDAPELAPARAALDAILHQQEPYPAVVMNRYWDIFAANQAASRFFSLLLGEEAASRPANVVRLVFSPCGLRPHLANWAEIAQALLARVQREAVGGVVDETLANLLREVLAYPGVPTDWRTLQLDKPLDPIIPMVFRHDAQTFQYFSTVTTLGTPQDITLQEIRIECFFPLDEATARQARVLATHSAAP